MEFRKTQKEEINAIELKYYTESVECDVRHFWKIVNSRRKTKSSICKLVTREKTASNPEDISDVFAEHFSTLYCSL